MGDTLIDWATKVWNPVTGCSKVSPGCDHCYAERMAKRLGGRYGYPKGDPFRVTFHEDRLDLPRKWKKPERIFVNSMGDWAHEAVLQWWLDKVFTVMEETDWHTYLLLTKRAEEMVEIVDGYLPRLRKHWPANVWPGVTVESQGKLWRLDCLLELSAPVLFVSIEPMLGELNLVGYLTNCDMGGCHLRNGEDCTDDQCPHWRGTRVNWVICGAETGAGKRFMNLNWARRLRDQCVATGTPFFFKKDSDGNTTLDGQEYHQFPEPTR